MSRPIEIRRAVQSPEYEAAGRLLREYEAALDADLCFQGFAAELAGLPARYGNAGRGLWLAWAGALPLGCVALEPADAKDRRTGELRRLYVRPESQGGGLGRALVETVLAAAQGFGYAALRLETLDRLQAANRLYESLGFVELADGAAPARPLGTRWMARPLRAADRPVRRRRQLGAQLG